MGSRTKIEREGTYYQMRLSWPRPVDPTKKLTCMDRQRCTLAYRRRETYGSQTVVDWRDDERVAHPDEAGRGEGCFERTTQRMRRTTQVSVMVQT